MADLVLTPKVAIFGGVQKDFPAVPFVTGSSAYVEVPISGHGISIPDETWYTLRAFFSAGGGNFGRIEFRESDGVTVIGTSPEINTSMTYSTPLKRNKSGAPLTGIRLFAKHSGVVDITVGQDSLQAYWADDRNMTDLHQKIHVTKIHFYSTGASEGVEGSLSVSSDNVFTTLEIDAIMTALIWSANSGATLYSWEGTKIGVVA